MPSPHQVPARVRDLGMTIGVSQRVRHVPFQGADDPSLPIGIWQGDVESTGDASGGANTVDFVFSNSGEEDDSFYSLEQFGEQHDVVTSQVRQVIFNNQHNYRAPQTPITSTIMGDGGTGILGRTSWQGKDLGWLPYFLGTSPPAQAAVQLFLRFATNNVTTVAYRVHAWGYRWGPRAFGTPTGPRRPPGSVFRT